jgi:glycosyltransferase involved in cell wall biosynthesis
MPRVSIITRTKNRHLLLQRAWLKSISQQVFQNFEWIIVNDGGAVDEVNNIAEKARETIPVKVIHYKESKGMEAASNAGISESDAEYILIHDDDDTIASEYLLKAVKYLDDHPEKGGVFCNILQCYERIRKDKIKVVRTRKYTELFKAIYLIDFLGYNPFVPISFTYRKSLHSEVGLYDETLPVVGDWDFFIRSLRHVDMGLIQDYLANYHIRLNGKESDLNSLTAKAELHAEYDACIRNKYLREDLSHGGIGLLMSQNYRNHYDRTILMKLDKVFRIMISFRNTFRMTSIK